MQFRFVPAFLVFLGSYFPLAVILALQDIKQESWELGFCWNFNNCVLPSSNHPYFSLLSILVTLACFLLTIKVLHSLRYKYSFTVLTSKPISSELISYSFPYIVAFMGVDYSSVGKVAGLIVFLILLFFITYRSGNIIMNPILIILGWNLYEVKVKINNRNRVVKLLCKTDPVPGEYFYEEIQGNYISLGGRPDDGF